MLAATVCVPSTFALNTVPDKVRPVPAVYSVLSFADVIVKISPLTAVEAPPAPTIDKVSLLLSATAVPESEATFLNMFWLDPLSVLVNVAAPEEMFDVIPVPVGFIYIKPTVEFVARSVSDCTTIKSPSTEAPAAAASWTITESPGVNGVAAFPKKLPATVTT